MCLVPKRHFPRREESVHELWRELDGTPRGTTIEAEFQSIRHGFVDMQRRLSMIDEKIDENLEAILSELEKKTGLGKQPSLK
jgi:hypothetical protein